MLFMLVTCLTIAVSVYVLYLHHHDDRSRPSPRLRRCISRLAKLVGRTYPDFEPDDEDGLSKVKTRSPARSRSGSILDGSMSDAKSNAKNIYYCESTKTCENITNNLNMTFNKGDEGTLQRILAILETSQAAAMSDHVTSRVQDEWKQIAQILDKFFFAVCGVCMVVMIVVMLVLVPYIASVVKNHDD